VSYAKFTPMSAPSAQSSTTRWSKPETSRLVLALVISLALHLTSYGVYEGGKALNLWEKLHTPAWFKKLMEAVTPQKAIDVAKQPDKPREAPLMFVDVDPAFASAEPPKDAKYYAAQSTRASNPDADKETDVPKISGEQERVMKTENTERVKPQPLQPALPPEPPVEEVKPKATLRPGDLTMAKPEDETKKGEGDSPKPRPRTIAEARAQQAQQQPLKTAGQRAKQDGGVRNRNVSSTLDAIGSPFGVYDAAIVAAIQNRWFDLLEERGYASERTGKVVLEFRLNYDGRITNLKVVEHTVDELLSLLCQKAILDPSPYAQWPSDMRRRAGADYREVRFTFYYN
jgi:outer membrane biosynthesis protein TonB